MDEPSTCSPVISTPMPRKKAVIVGGGAAGTSCAINLSIHAPNLDIVLVDPQPSLKLCYALTHLSHTTLDTTVIEAEANSWCEQRNITFFRAHAVDLTPNRVILSSGESLFFDVCCLATGASPYVPQSLRDPEFAEQVLTLRDTESVIQLKKRLGSCRRIIVVGGGGIGMEAVHELDNCQIVWVIKDSHIGGTFFDHSVAQRLQFLPAISSSSCTQQGQSFPKHSLEKSDYKNSVRQVSAAAVGPNWLGRRDGPILFHHNNAITRNSDNPKRLSCAPNSERDAYVYASCEVSQLRKDLTGKWRVLVDLTNGRTEGCDAIIAGTGVTPNTDWTKRTFGLSIRQVNEPSVVLSNDDKGFRVAAADMETSTPGVFAAGDCAHVVPIDGTDWVQLRTWGQALAGGRAVAFAMAKRLGVEDFSIGLEFEVFAHATQFFGHRVVLLGRWKAQGITEDFRIMERCSGNSFVRVVLVNGRVRGAILVGDVDNAEVFENLIAGQMNVSWLGEGLVDENIELENYFD